MADAARTAEGAFLLTGMGGSRRIRRILAAFCISGGMG
jgi:hypothetical protein